MILNLIRRIYTDTYTEGELYLGEEKLADTLEDTVRPLKCAADKVPGKTAIPAGYYRVIVTYSPKFKRQMPLLCNVPYFEGVRIHAGNTAEDSSGCILCGRKWKPGTLTMSRVITEKVYNRIFAEVLKEGGSVKICIE